MVVEAELLLRASGAGLRPALERVLLTSDGASAPRAPRAPGRAPEIGI